MRTLILGGASSHFVLRLVTVSSPVILLVTALVTVRRKSASSSGAPRYELKRERGF